MARKKGAISLDTMMKAVMQNYEIPTRKDIDRLLSRIDRLEKAIKNRVVSQGRGYAAGKLRGRVKIGMSATDAVLGAIKSAKAGLDFKGIQAKTGFEDKKLRNIIFRLNKLGRIQRKNRGLYTAL